MGRTLVIKRKNYKYSNDSLFKIYVRTYMYMFKFMNLTKEWLFGLYYIFFRKNVIICLMPIIRLSQDQMTATGP